MENYKDLGLWSIIKSIIINFIIVIAFAGFFKQSLYVENVLHALYGSVLITIFYKFIRPLLLMISIVPIVMTFGIFIVIINAAIISLVSYILSPNFEISSFWSALGLAIFISVFNALISNDRKIIIKKL